MKQDAYRFLGQMSYVNEQAYNVTVWACSQFYLWEMDTRGVVWA